MRYSGTTRAPYGWEPAKICMASRRSAPFAPPAPPPVWPAAGLARDLRHTTITTFGADMAVCSTEFTREGSARLGRQQQTWVRFPYGWRIVAAQVSLMD